MVVHWSEYYTYAVISYHTYRHIEKPITYGGVHIILLPTLVIYKALDLVARVTEH